MSGIPDPIPGYINTINQALTGLFPPTDRDLKAHIAAMKAFLNNKDPNNSKVKDLLSLKTHIIEQASPENKKKIENAFTDQVSKRVKRYNAISSQMHAIQKRQAEFHNNINPEKANTSLKNPSLKELQKILKQDFPLSDLATLEACVLLALAKPIYEETILQLHSDQASLEAIQRAQEQLNGLLKQDPSIKTLTSSLSGAIIRCPAYLAGDVQPKECFERDEIEEFILKRHVHPYELDLTGSKRAVSMAEIQIDTDLENERKEAFTRIYHSILEGSDLSFNDMPESLILASKNLATNNDKWSSPLLSQHNNPPLKGITDMISFSNTLDEKLIIAALIALASPGDEYLSSEISEQSMKEASIKLLNRLEQDPVLSHYNCPITYNLLRDPICINNLNYYENTAFNNPNNPYTFDPLTRLPISSKEPATEMKNFIINRIKEICSSLILTQTMLPEIWEAKIHALEIPAIYCSNTLKLTTIGIESSIQAIGIESVIQAPERETIIQSAERKSIIMNRGIETVIRTIEYLEKHELDFSGKCCSLKKILTMPGSTLKIDLLSLDKELQNDREVVLTAVTQNGSALQFASESLKNDREVVLAAVTQNGSALQFASESLKNDRKVVLAAVTQNGKVLQFVNEEFKNDRKIVLAAVRQDGWALRFASQELRNDPEVVLAAVRQYGTALQFASQELRNDPEVVLAAVTQDGQALRFASQDLKNDRDVVLAAVTQNGSALQHASEALRNDREIVLAAVTQDGQALKFVNEELKNDRKIVLAATTQNSLAIHFAGEPFKNNRESVLAVVIQSAWYLQHISESLKSDRDFILAAVTQNGKVLQFVNEEFKNDRKIVLAAVTQDGWALRSASKELQNDREIVLAAVTQDGWALRFASKELQNDREIVLAAIKQDGQALKFASLDFQKDQELFLTTISQQDQLLQFKGIKNRRRRQTELQEYFWSVACNLLDENEELKNDRELILAIVQYLPSAFQFASEKLKKDKAFCLKALKTNKHIYLELSPDMQRDLNIIQAYFESVT